MKLGEITVFYAMSAWQVSAGANDSTYNIHVVVTLISIKKIMHNIFMQKFTPTFLMYLR